MKHFFLTRLLACLATMLLMWPSQASAVPFTPGNLVVVRIGDGVTVTASGTSAATFLLEYTPAGVLVQTIALPVAPSGTNRALSNTASSSSDALLTRTVDGGYLVLTGYDAAPGTATLLTPAASVTNRIIGRVAPDGTVDTSTRISDAFDGTNIRSAASVNGSAFYAVGANTGVRYLPFGNASSTTAISTSAPTNIRGVNIFDGNLYVTSASTTFQGVSQVGTGLPTTGPQTIVALPGFPTATGPSPYGFYFADLSTTVPGVDVVYIADDRTVTPGGIQKWSLVGGTWTLNGSTTSTTALRGLDGTTAGGTVSLVASGVGGVFLVTDNAGYNAAPSLATVPAAIVPAPGTNAVFRGVAFAPVAAPTTAPTITSFTPASGPAGTVVVISGTNLTGATAVTLNGTALTGFTVNAAGTELTVTVPAGSATGVLAVTTPGGTATSTTSFTFVPATPAPTIASFTPASGQAGETVTITGTDFTGATALTLNGAAITGFTVVNATTITFVVPAGATSGTIAVTTPGGSATSSGTFTVIVPNTAPTITGIAPATAVAGAAAFTLTVDGTGFLNSSVVNFNGAALTTTFVSATQLTAAVPATAVATAGSFAVTVTNPAPGGGTSAGATFVVTAPPAPTITSFTPTSGASGATVTITGTDFTGATAVTLNGLAITGFTVGNATTITFVVPATATSGVIAVTTPNGTATSTGTFTVTPAVVTPVVSAISPNAQVVGGPDVTLTITGTGFTPTSTVNFNSVSYTQTSSTATSLVVTIPAAALATAGSFPVTVTNTAGTSNILTFIVSSPSTAGAFENFETGTKTAYAAGTVTLNSGIWNFSNALLGTSFADKFNGLQSARIRPNGFIAMNFDKATGAGVITVNAALYGTDAPASFLLEFSTDGGTTYTAATGAPAALTATLTPYTFTVNQAGNVRLRISNTNTVAAATVPRIIIDDISITNFTAPVLVPTITSFTPATGGPGTAVTITGTNFTGATAVNIGSFAVTSFTVVSATSITLVVPTGTGSVNGLITVTTPGGTATSAATFNLVSATLASKALPGLSVFPNPATDRLTVSLPQAGAATVALRDLTGRVVLAPAALAADREVRLPATLAAGTYLLEVRQGSVTAVRRIQKY